MGGGGLRILPHKKWHVWRRDNIERVLRDERENEEKQQDLNAKERRLEQERRAQQLLHTEGQNDQQQRHINFFQAEEAKASSREADKRRNNCDNGADDTLKKHGKLPWYAQSKDAQKTQLTVKHERKRKRELEVEDPLQHMRPKAKRGQHSLFATPLMEKERRRRSEYIVDKEGPAGSDRRKYSARYDRSSTSPRRGERRHTGEDEADNISKRHSKGREKKNKSRHKLSKKEAMLQELRRERREREDIERRRAESLMFA